MPTLVFEPASVCPDWELDGFPGLGWPWDLEYSFEKKLLLL